MIHQDTLGETTPVWMVAKNAGATTWDMSNLLQSKGLWLTRDANGREAVYKSELLRLLIDA
ncbi:hypothetical protein [Rhodococcus ruber]